jgi:oxygen-independent coproporphyrinogen-3 oxidase
MFESRGERHVVIDGISRSMSIDQIEQYSQPGPRYTSYPTAPEWHDGFDPAAYIAAVESSSRPLSLYVHVPFCQSLCLFCGCNVIINKNKSVAAPYLERLKQEIEETSSHVSGNRMVEQIHWGGGTPTYLAMKQIEELFTHISSRFSLSDSAEISIEIEPRTTTEEQLKLLRGLGFNRISMGVQDFDPLVQKTVRRIQPYEMTREVYDWCRELGFDSINIDLIYGLPHQSPTSFADTVEKVIDMSPDRIALFSYAHVPWLKKQQGSFARHLPPTAEKFEIFCNAMEMLVAAGYRYIGLDHFVKPTDELSRALDARTLHRNFQGYTTKAGCDLLGMGVSSISMLDDVYAQNWRDILSYYRVLDNGLSPIMRGISLTDEDRLRRSVINQILCHGVVVKSEIEREFSIDFDRHFALALQSLDRLVASDMVVLSDDRIEVIGFGKIFVRNIAMAFDAYLDAREAAPQRLFSNTV